MPGKRGQTLLGVGLVLCGGLTGLLTAGPSQAIHEASGVRGGLVVHVGCGQGRLTAELHASDRYVVQGLDRNADHITAARQHIQALGLYGKVSVRHWHRDYLPYGDNMVDLVVLSDSAKHTSRDEIMRVLAPRGVCVTTGASGIPSLKWSKPVPADIDDWTHYLHDAGNNAVAEDERVGPPKHIQWKSAPMWCRSHEFASSVQAMVSANGRMISIIDEGIIGQPRGVPTLWALIAQNAFNGIRLWRLPCDPVNPHALVALGDKVYVTLIKRAPMSILDAATGETLHTCDATGEVEELAVCEGRVVLNTQLTDSRGKKGVPHVATADATDGRLLWKTAAQTIAKNTLVVGNGRVCYFSGNALVCLSLESGEELWRTPAKTSGRGYAILNGDTVFLTGGSTRAFSLESGTLLWSGPDGNPHARNPPGLFVANGLVWRAWDHVDPRSFLWQHREEVRSGCDPLTGEVKRTIRAERLVTAGHHIRCYPPKATSRYLMLNKRGVEFFDLEGTNHMRANWTRGACGFGMLPANGFLYTPPSQCFCYPGALLTGFNALSATREPTQHQQGPRLQSGPAFTRNADVGDPAASTDWPTYRHDDLRSGAIDTDLPVELERVWVTSLCAPAFRRYVVEERRSDDTHVLLDAKTAAIHGTGARKDDTAVVAWRGKDTYISWHAHLDRAGKQTVWVLQANQGSGGSVFELTVGSDTLTGKIRHTDTWQQYVWVRVGNIDVPAAGAYIVTLKALEQVEGRLGNVAAVAIGGDQPPAGDIAHDAPKLRERPHGGLTPPVAAAGKVFVAEPDAHSIHAIDAASGEHAWSFTADGRIDSPPTIHEELCIFGCTDGHVYCLAASDGALVWRFRAAPKERQICVMGQLESAWPVHGSVLVRDGKVYCTAGRSTYLDGGIRVYALTPTTGNIIHETVLHSEDPDTSTDGGRPFDTDGVRSDILVAGAEDIYLFQERLNGDLTRQPMERVTKLGDRMGESHLITTDGFLDKTWFNRTYWTHSERWPGYYFSYRGPKSGQLVVFDDENTYALKVYTERRGHSPEFQPGTGYRLIADRNGTKPVLDVMDIGAEKGRGFSRTELSIWSAKIPIRAHGMVLARNHLYLTGPPDLLPEQNAYEAMIGKKGALFRVVSTADGRSLAEFRLEAVPVFDGLIAAGNRLYMSTLDGTVICFGEKK